MLTPESPLWALSVLLKAGSLEGSYEYRSDSLPEGLMGLPFSVSPFKISPMAMAPDWPVRPTYMAASTPSSSKNPQCIAFEVFKSTMTLPKRSVTLSKSSCSGSVICR